MKNITHPRNTLFTSISLILLLGVFSSCSSSKNGYYSDDGIYGKTDSREKEEVVMVRDTRSDYYQNYFAGEKEYHDEIFTDIDSYKGYQDSDTVYVDEGYVEGNPPWEYSNSQVTVNIGLGFGGGWGWGYGWGYPYYGWGYPGWAYGWNYPYYGWGWGYPGWGWTYPGWGWGYPGYGWGHPGWGWGPGWGYYPPYHGPYTYGKRYAHNTSRLNTTNVYNERSLSSRYNRSSSNFDRRVATNYSRGRYPSSADKSARTYDRSSRTGASRSNPSYNRSSGGKYNSPSSRGYNSRSYNRSSPGVRSSSGMSRGGGMSRSSGRRHMSYVDLDNTPYGSNKTFIKRGNTVKRASGDSRISYSKARSNPNYQRTIRSNPAVSGNNSGSYRTGTIGSMGRGSGNAYKSSGQSSANYRSSSGRSGSSMRSSGGGSRPSAPSRSGGGGGRSSRNR